MREALVVVKDVSAKNAFELALIENVQREDLNPVELAEAFDRLLREHGYTQEALAERLGKDRTTIANALRLLKLPARVRAKVIAGELTRGARPGAARRGRPGRSSSSWPSGCCAGSLSVRATEALVRDGRGRRRSGGARTRAPPAGGPRRASATWRLRLTRALGTKVEVRDRGNKGEVAIPYADLDALDRIIDKLLK